MYRDQSFLVFFRLALYIQTSLWQRGFCHMFKCKVSRMSGGEKKITECHVSSPSYDQSRSRHTFKRKCSSNIICCYCSLWIPLQMSQELERYFSGNMHKQINKLSQAEDNLNIWEPAQACQASHRHSGTGKINLQPLISVPKSRIYINHPLYEENCVFIK